MSSGKRLRERPRPVPAQQGARLDEKLAGSQWACPNGKCRHGRLVHDGDGNDEPFMCCVDGCDCRG